MDKEKEIQEMAKLLDESCSSYCSYCNCKAWCKERQYAKTLYNEGYRKADEVRKEAAKEILTMLYKEAVEYGKETIGIEWMAQKYGVEVKNEGNSF